MQRSTTIIARRFEEKNYSLQEFRLKISKLGPFNPQNQAHVQLIKTSLRTFHAHDIAIAWTDAKLVPLAMLAIAASLYSFLLAIVFVALSAGLAISDNRLIQGRAQQAELKELIVLHDWCTGQGSKNLKCDIVQKLEKTIAPKLRNPADYNITAHEKLADWQIIQFIKDIHHALNVAAYGLPTSEYELPQVEFEAEPATDASMLTSVWSAVPSLSLRK